MSLIRILIVVGLAGGAYHYWKGHRAESIQAVSGPAVSTNGFVALPPADGQNPRSVYVIAAENCPHEDAQRADRLAEDLGRKGIPVVRSHNISFSLNGADSSVANRISSVMNGPLPIVFVQGRAKSNPSLDEVLAEYQGAGR